MNRTLLLIIITTTAIFSDSWSYWNFEKNPTTYSNNYSYPIFPSINSKYGYYDSKGDEYQKSMMRFSDDSIYERIPIPQTTSGGLNLRRTSSSKFINDSILYYEVNWAKGMVEYNMNKGTFEILYTSDTTNPLYTPRVLRYYNEDISFTTSQDSSGRRDAVLVSTDNYQTWTRYDSINSNLKEWYSLYDMFKRDSSGNFWARMNNWGNYNLAGVVKFDGSTWEVFGKEAGVLSHNYVNDYDIQQNGDVWFATKSGITRYSNGEWKRWDDSTKGYNREFKLITFEGDTGVWFQGEPSLFWNGKEMVEKLGDTVANSLDIFPYFIREDNTRWYFHHSLPGNDEIMITWKYENGKWVVFSKEGGYPKLPTHTVNATNIYFRSRVAPNGDLWIKYDEKNYPDFAWKNYPCFRIVNDTLYDYSYYNTGLANDTVHAITSDNNGYIYTASSYGIQRFNGSLKWRGWDTSMVAFSFHNVSKMECDKSNKIWAIITNNDSVGTPIASLTDTTWTVIDTKDRLPSNMIFASTISNDGTLYLAHGNGITTVDNGKWTDLPTPPFNDIKDITVDDNGNLWCAASRGVLRWNNSEWKSWESNTEPLFESRSRSIIVDTAGDILVGSNSDGIRKYDGTLWSKIDGSPSNCEKIYTDTFGNLWVFTPYDGLYRFKNGEWKSYSKDSTEILSDNITTFNIDKDGSKWFGYKTDGISRLIDEDIVSISNSKVKDINATNSFKLSFTNNIIHYSIPSINRNTRFNLYDLKGRLLKSISINNLTGVINLDQLNLSKGILIATLKNGNSSLVRKIALW